MQNAKSGMQLEAEVIKTCQASGEIGHLVISWDFECFDKDGNLKWTEHIPHNLVTTAGKDKYLDSTIKTGVTSPTWYVGLKDTGTPVVADTMASHASWAELSALYNEATRPAYTPGTISSGSVDNSASKASFSINATGTPDDIYGAFLVNNNTKGGSTGDLLCVGDFASPRTVSSGDTLNVQVTLTIT